MTDREIREALKALDSRTDVELSSWECDFLNSILFTIEIIMGPSGTIKLTSDAHYPLSPKQREKALEIIERYEVDDHDGGQETITKIPDDMKRYFKQP